jgi:hypothetical protein
MKRLGAIVFAGLALLALHAPAALAAPPPPSPYPPGKPPNAIGPKPGGSVFTVTSCGFKANTIVWVYFNDTFVETASTDASGCAHQAVTVSCTGPTVTIDGHVTPAKKGSNDLLVGGPKPNGQSNSVTTRFEITGCGNTKNQIGSGSALAFNVHEPTSDGQAIAAAEVAGVEQSRTAAKTRASSGALAFTGANAIRVSAAALCLILLGALMLQRERRRDRAAGRQ